MTSESNSSNENPSQDPFEGFTWKEVGRYVLDEGRLTTPDSIDDNVIEFCNSLSPSCDPVFLKPNPQKWSRYMYCDKNVEHIIKWHGGTTEFGYRIWYVPDLFIEAERHAIWNKPDGTRMDISFYPGGEKKILFLPDPTIDTVIIPDHLKPRKALHPKMQPVIDYLVNRELKNPSLRDTSWKGWEFAPSYDEWVSRGRPKKLSAA